VENAKIPNHSAVVAIHPAQILWILVAMFSLITTPEITLNVNGLKPAILLGAMSIGYARIHFPYYPHNCLFLYIIKNCMSRMKYILGAKNKKNGIFEFIKIENKKI
jgi:hypothetical protein